MYMKYVHISGDKYLLGKKIYHWGTNGAIQMTSPACTGYLHDKTSIRKFANVGLNSVSDFRNHNTYSRMSTEKSL